MILLFSLAANDLKYINIKTPQKINLIIPRNQLLLVKLVFIAQTANLRRLFVVVVNSGEHEQTSSQHAKTKQDTAVTTDTALLLAVASSSRTAAAGLNNTVSISLGGVLEIRLGGQVGTDGVLVDDVTDQRLHMHTRGLYGFKHLRVGSSNGVLLASDGLVGNEGQTQDLHATVLGSNNLRDSGHTHGVTTNRAKKSALSLGLVARTGDEAVGSVRSDLVVQLESLRSIKNHVLELLVVGITHRRESGAKRIVINASERVIAGNSGLINIKEEKRKTSQNIIWNKNNKLTHQTEVILNNHDISNLKVGVQATSRVGYDKKLDTKESHCTDRHDDLFHGVTFVEVESSTHANHLDTTHSSEHQLTGMASDSSSGEARDISVIESNTVL